jgi:hypothetical protein
VELLVELEVAAAEEVGFAARGAEGAQEEGAREEGAREEVAQEEGARELAAGGAMSGDAMTGEELCRVWCEEALLHSLVQATASKMVEHVLQLSPAQLERLLSDAADADAAADDDAADDDDDDNQEPHLAAAAAPAAAAAALSPHSNRRARV